MGRLATLKLLAQRFAFLTLVLASFALMLLGKADTILVERLRVFIDEEVAPILSVLSRPAGAMADVAGAVHDLATLRAENVRLAEENARLAHWQTTARQLANENKVLRAQLNFVPGPDASFITARVIGDTGGSFVHSMLIDAGAADGVRKGQAVMDGEVMVGRVEEVGEHVARMLLLTDINSHIPVMLESSRAKAVLTGDNTDRPRLNYLAPNSADNPGERVVTSGHGGAFPPGLLIGAIVATQDGAVRVEPLVHRDHLEYVTVVEYGLPGILPSDMPSDGHDR